MANKISIVGGGITGLTTAIALGQKGISCSVYERADALKEVGAGIWLQPNAMRVLDILGLKPKIEENGSLIDVMEITNPQLIPHKEIPSDLATDKYGNRTIGIHRATLQEILYNKALETAEIYFGKTYISHESTSDKITIQFEDETVETDILLGADGIHSNVRKTIFPNAEIRESYQMCWRGIVNIQLPKHLKNKGKESWGNNLRFGFSEIDTQQNVYWFAVQKGGSNKLTASELAKQFHYFNPIVSEIIRSTSYIHCAELNDLKRLKTWHSQNVCLMGDAAHATTPNMGQGAGQGIEDAIYMAHFLKKHTDPKIAFSEFEKVRRQKVDYVVNNSWLLGKLAHTRLGRFFLTNTMKITPSNIMAKQMSKLYSVEID
jgi:2-polyprenyl-6-methoxyphenol hydroxylase-like FAD-dependent oxidoreductase